LSAEGKQRFPTWWQALILIVGGAVIGLSSCVGALSGIGGGRPSQFAGLYVTGFFAGVAAFFAGIILFIVMAIRALLSRPQGPTSILPAPPQAGGVISHATHPQLFPDATASAAAPPVPVEVQYALARFRIAIFVAILASSVGLWRMAAFPRWTTYSRHYFLISVVGFVLSQLPWVVVLVRTWKVPDRVGLALAIAAGSVYVLTTGGFLTNWQYSSVRLDPILWMHAGLDVVIVVLAYLVRRAASLRGADAQLLITFFFSVLIYWFMVSLFLKYLSVALASR
jgi:hypothetical protein